MNGGNGVVRVHFLNVGHGDCTLIEHASGRLTMIDINNGDDLDPDSATALKLRARPGAVVCRCGRCWGRKVTVLR